ncbi:MAG: NAD-dependent epimerase/dehydratase family protein [Chthoniobacter sp.]|nr:NAD-dependent epimerase/dehydratase family protein [Chthoniobacter sp.]
MTKVLITGAAGFVGCHLATELSQRPGYELTLVDNFARGKRDDDLGTLLARPNVRLISADLSSPEAFALLGGGYDHVYHLAAIIGVKNVLSRPYDVVRINALTTLHLLEWFRQGSGGKLLFSSTSEAYAWTQQFHALPIPTPENVPLALTEIANPRSSYAGSKIFGELAITHGCAVANKPFAIVRYHNVYGPRMGFEHVIPELYERSLAGENPLVVYSTNHSRAFCYVSDAITATIAAMENEAANGLTLNIGNDEEEVTIGDLAQRILTKVRPDAQIESREAKHDPILRRCPDIRRAREVIGYHPRVALDEGLDRTFAWYRPHLPRP